MKLVSIVVCAVLFCACAVYCDSVPECYNGAAGAAVECDAGDGPCDGGEHGRRADTIEAALALFGWVAFFALATVLRGCQ